MPYDYSRVPARTRQQLTKFVDETKNIIEAGLLGIYLHGSLAMGCFNPTRSDIDLLLVVDQPLCTLQRRDFAQLLLGISNRPHPVELSVLTYNDLHPWRHPAPYDFHYSEDWREPLSNDLAMGAWQQWQRPETGDPDLAGHMMITRKRGFCLVGAPILTIFPEVAEQDYTASITADVRWAWARVAENPIYFVLNFCRTIAWLCEKQVLSKEEGGVWALQNLPTAYHASIHSALRHYRTSSNPTTNPKSSQPIDVAMFEQMLRSMPQFSLKE